MIRNSIEYYPTVLSPLITVIEYAIIATHAAKEIIIIRFITLGNVYFIPPLQIHERPFFDESGKTHVIRRLIKSCYLSSTITQRPI